MSAVKEKEVRLIVRIVGKDLNGKVSVERALLNIKGIDKRLSGLISRIFIKNANLNENVLLGEINDEQAAMLEKIVLNPLEYGIPSWAVNRRNDFETGEDSHLVMNDLAFALRQDLQKLSEIKSYRGLRHIWKLPVRGQRNKSTHRGKGKAVGVSKRDNKKR